MKTRVLRTDVSGSIHGGNQFYHAAVRWQRALLVGLGVSLFVCAALAEPPAKMAASERVESVDSIGMTVSNLERAVEFFTHVLTFEKTAEVDISGPSLSLDSPRMRTARLRLGDEFLELTEFTEPKGRPFPTDSRSNDCWFQHIAIIVSDMDRAYARLQANGVRAASRGPQILPDWNANASGIKAYYFRDPDGHFLEVLQFPPGKGDPKWQRKSDRLFLGIDHTAIVVADTEASLRLYRDALGLRVAGSSENYGKEQEALNNVNGAHLRITTLRAAAGPGIELLEYLKPRDGRAYPSDARANDLLYWQTTLRVRNANQIANLSRGGGSRQSRAGAISEGEQRIIIRDPDGHSLVLSER